MRFDVCFGPTHLWLESSFIFFAEDYTLSSHILGVRKRGAIWGGAALFVFSHCDLQVALSAGFTTKCVSSCECRHCGGYYRERLITKNIICSSSRASKTFYVLVVEPLYIMYYSACIRRAVYIPQCVPTWAAQFASCCDDAAVVVVVPEHWTVVAQDIAVASVHTT